MRKIISFVLIFILALSGFSSAFAAEASVPSDVKDTIYEDSVKTLVSKGVITGYSDGTFRPENTISRAEACVIVVKSMGPTDEALIKAGGTGFPDLKDFDWAEKYIEYAATKGVISGYPDGNFRPENFVTYNEMATMLVLALGYKANELNGNWPDNFLTKAKELGMLTGFSYKAGEPALRGHVALMDYAVIDDIIKANKPDDAAKPDKPSDGSDYAKLAGPLAEYTGRAYGMILDKAKVLDKDAETVEQLEFLFGNKTLYLNTNGKSDVDLSKLSDRLNAGDLFGLKMRNGIVQRVGSSEDDFSNIGLPKNFEDFTNSEWKEVTEVKNKTVTLKDNTTESRSVLEDASVYVAVFEDDQITEYKSGSVHSIKPGCWVRLYSVTGDESGVAEVVVVKEK